MGVKARLLRGIVVWLFYGNEGRVINTCIDIGVQLLKKASAENELPIFRLFHGTK